MRIYQYVRMTVIVLSLISSLLVWTNTSVHYEVPGQNSEDGKIPYTLEDANDLDGKKHALSQSPVTGIISPASIVQSGYQTTDLASGRVDSATNTVRNITIDEANGWFVNKTEIEVTQLRRMYAANGSFSNGTSPWTSYSVDGGSNTQIASYNESGGHVMCRNMGEYHPGLGGSYVHSQGTEIGWEQVFDNAYSEVDIRLEFEFRYPTGPA
jgi:hypothetical protein